MSSVPHSLPPPIHRSAWGDNITSYVDAPASAPHMSSQAMYYQRSVVTSLDDHEPLSAGTIAPAHHIPQM